MKGISAAKQPWMKFYPSDWRGDPKLRSCSLAARGLWMEMLCIMHEATPRGFLIVNGQTILSRQLAALAGDAPRNVAVLLDELESAGVFSRNAEGVIYSRRILRDEQRATRNQRNGKRGGNPTLLGSGSDNPSDNPRVNPSDKPGVKAQKLEAREDPSQGRIVPLRLSGGRADDGGAA